MFKQLCRAQPAFMGRVQDRVDPVPALARDFQTRDAFEVTCVHPGASDFFFEFDGFFGAEGEVTREQAVGEDAEGPEVAPAVGGGVRAPGVGEAEELWGCVAVSRAKREKSVL